PDVSVTMPLTADVVTPCAPRIPGNARHKLTTRQAAGRPPQRERLMSASETGARGSLTHDATRRRWHPQVSRNATVPRYRVKYSLGSPAVRDNRGVMGTTMQRVASRLAYAR